MTITSKLDKKKLELEINELNEIIDKIYSKNQMLICSWCGDNIEHLENVVLKNNMGAFYHLKCMTHVHESEIKDSQL